MDAPAYDSMSAELQSALLDVLPHLRAFARSLTRNRDQADDLVNDAIVRAISASQQFTPGTNFKAWIFTILRNLFYNEGRKRHSRFTSIDDLTVNQINEELSDEQSKEILGGGFGGGVYVAAGDVNGDGTPDIITGAATVSGHVKVFDGTR